MLLCLVMTLLPYSSFSEEVKCQKIKGECYIEMTTIPHTVKNFRAYSEKHHVYLYMLDFNDLKPKVVMKHESIRLEADAKKILDTYKRGARKLQAEGICNFEDPDQK